jgi:hypothetical protein
VARIDGKVTRNGESGGNCLAETRERASSPVAAAQLASRKRCKSGRLRAFCVAAASLEVAFMPRTGAALIPIYNLIVLLEIVEKPIWWLILFLIPIANLIVAIIVGIELAHRFGKSTAFGWGAALLWFIFIPILGFGDARYQPSPA